MSGFDWRLNTSPAASGRESECIGWSRSIGDRCGRGWLRSNGSPCTGLCSVPAPGLFLFAPAFGVPGLDLSRAFVGDKTKSPSSKPSRNGSALLFLGVPVRLPPLCSLRLSPATSSLSVRWACLALAASRARSCSRNLLSAAMLSRSRLTASNSAFCLAYAS